MELNIFANRKEAATKKKRRTASEIDKSFTVIIETFELPLNRFFK